MRLRERRFRLRPSLSDAERLDLFLGSGTRFDSPAAERRAWLLHRDRLLAEWHLPGMPEAWWRHEATSAPDELRRHIVGYISYPRPSRDRPPRPESDPRQDAWSRAYWLQCVLKAEQDTARAEWLKHNLS